MQGIKVISLVSFLIMLTGAIGLILRNSVFLLNPVTLTLALLALALMLWARITFGSRSFNPLATPSDAGLVTSGPYRYIRHPIYTAACIFCIGLFLARPSLLAAACELSVIVGALGRIHAEEQLLRQQYPAYREYALRTKRMIPYFY